MKRYFRESVFCRGEFPGMQYEIFPSNQEGFFEWNDKVDRLRGEGRTIAEIGKIYGMDGEAVLISIDCESIEKILMIREKLIDSLWEEYDYQEDYENQYTSGQKRLYALSEGKVEWRYYPSGDNSHSEAEHYGRKRDEWELLRRDGQGESNSPETPDWDDSGADADDFIDPIIEAIKEIPIGFFDDERESPSAEWAEMPD